MLGLCVVVWPISSDLRTILCAKVNLCSNPNSSTVLDGKSLHLAPKIGCDSPMGHSLTDLVHQTSCSFLSYVQDSFGKNISVLENARFLAERRHVAAPSRFCSYEICYLAGNPNILKEMLLMLKKVTCTKIKIGSFFSLLPRFYTSQEGAGFLPSTVHVFKSIHVPC